MELVKKILKEIYRAQLVPHCSDFPSVPTAEDGRHECKEKQTNKKTLSGIPSIYSLSREPV